MVIQPMGSICILPQLNGLGGPASFRARLVAGLQARGVQVLAAPDDPGCTSILMIGATRHIDVLLRARRRGVRIVQRLNGMNWIHRRKFTGVRHFLRSEINNLLLAQTRRHLVDAVVYQSQFAQTWWHTVYGKLDVPVTVIYNGVDLQEFHPQGHHSRPVDRVRLLLVEGNLGGGYEVGLFNAAALANSLGERLSQPVELMVVGRVAERLRAQVESTARSPIHWAGAVPRAEIPAIDRSAHVLFSADLNAACPNSVIEALACGLPVVAYATGSLPELLQNGAGMVVPWGSNFWKLEPPDLTVLVDAAQRVLDQQAQYRAAARARAEAAFGLDEMSEKYLAVLKS